MKRVALLSAALLLSVTASFGSGVLVEAESFRDKGGWAVDQQFMDQMGSPYLIAHGMGKPVADAVTTVEFPETGTYRVYVRTFNWVAPWYDGEGPGKFALRVGIRKLSATLYLKTTGLFVKVDTHYLRQQLHKQDDTNHAKRISNTISDRSQRRVGAVDGNGQTRCTGQRSGYQPHHTRCIDAKRIL